MKQKGQRILVTGASGFLGREVVNELQNGEKYEIYGLIGRNSKPESVENLSPSNILKADISEYSTLKPVEKNFAETETVVHTAGLAHQFGRVTKEDFWKTNVQGTENICRLAGQVGARHLILISSVSVYDDYENVEIDESFECRPAGFYAESKLESELRAREFCSANDLRLTILRPATIIGEGDRGNTARLIKLIDKKRFIWVGDGSNKKSLIYKRDVARGILKVVAARREGEAEVYNLTAKAVSMREIVSVIARNLRSKTPRLRIPENLVRGFFKVNRTPFSVEYLKKFERTFEKWLSDDIFSGKKFNERFDFEPATPISEALAKQADHYLRHRK